MKNEERSEDYD